MISVIGIIGEVGATGNDLCAVLCEIDRLRALDERQFLDAVMRLEDVARSNMRYGHQVLAQRMEVDLLTRLRRHVLDGLGAAA